MAAGTDHTRHHALDHPRRPPLHHHTHHLPLNAQSTSPWPLADGQIIAGRPPATGGNGEWRTPKRADPQRLDTGYRDLAGRASGATTQGRARWIDMGGSSFQVADGGTNCWPWCKRGGVRTGQAGLARIAAEVGAAGPARSTASGRPRRSQSAYLAAVARPSGCL